MNKLNPNDPVYVPCPEHAHRAFLAGCVTQISGGAVSVELRDPAGAPDGGVRHVARADVRLRFERDDGSTSQDNTSLVHMNDAEILCNLQQRHQQDKIYTYTASVLLAVNPYKQIESLYGEEECRRYRGKHLGALPPHPYAIADTAYRTLVREQKNQGLLISGESGAGKTETAKIVMNYLAYASGTASELASQIQARVLHAQPILESLGNAATMRNSNSSRFGKYNRVFFSDAGTLVDAGITTYLLESSRVVVHSSGERTYHCFYEMLAGMPDEKLQEFELDRSGRYCLMANGQNLHGHEERDAKNFRRLCDAFRTVGLDDEAIDARLQVLAGLVHLGDAQSARADDEAERDGDEIDCVELDAESVGRAARLLGMDPDDLSDTLRWKKVAVPGRNSFHKVPRSESLFRQALHSLIKAVYKRLFERTVQDINASFMELRPATETNGGGVVGATPADAEDTAASALRHIGILDIYGFEQLKQNSFEQLCINLANERLQQYFVENVLVAEQNLYRREGLPWQGLALPDSQPVVNCIAQTFRVLDEFSQQLVKGLDSANDGRFCQKVLEEAARDPQKRDVFKQLRMSNKKGTSTGPAMNEGFIIRHYAGWVEYNTKGWLDKNNDRLLAECEALICESTFPFVRSLSDEDQGKAPFRSISKKYMTDLEALLHTLSTCNLHYIRCFKPNGVQKPNKFEQQMVLDQIIQCGTIELVKIMYEGYPNRCPFDEITQRFRSMLPDSFQRYGMRTFIEALMLAYDVQRDEWALGMSRLFLKAGQLRALEDMRSAGAEPDAERLSEIVSGIVRKRWGRAVNAVRFCLYVPKLITQIYVRRTATALSRAALVAGRLAPRLEAARQGIARRRLQARGRLVGAFHAVRFLTVEWTKIRRRRRERLVVGLYRACFLQTRTRAWLARARGCLADARRRQEAVRLREEQRRRLEEEKRREEEERARLEEEQKRREWDQIQEERRRLEEERQHLLEQHRLREEERQREEARMREEAQQRELERERELARQKEEDRLRLQEERRQLEAERKALEQERLKQTKLTILAQASPLHSKRTPCSEAAGAGESASREAMSTSPFAMPTPSQSSVKPEQKEQIERQINEELRVFEQEFKRKQEEVMQQMRELQEKNESLERRLEEERAATRGATSPSHQRQPRCRSGSRRRYSQYSSSEDSSPSPSPSPPPFSTNDMQHRHWWAEQRQFLLEDLFMHDTM